MISFDHFNIVYQIRTFDQTSRITQFLSCDSKNFREMEETCDIIDRAKSMVLFVVIIVSTYVLRIILFRIVQSFFDI